MRDVAELPSIAIVIPTFNEARVVARCMEAIARQEYPKDRVEIVVMDNGSTDATTEICEGFGSRVLRRPDLSVAGLRNAGAAASTSDVLAFLDADCVPAPDWLHAAVRSLRLEPCITGATYETPTPAHWIERAWHATEATGRVEVTHINAGNLIVWRQDFTMLNGFDEHLVTGEDYEFAQRARARVRVIADDRIRVIHLGNPRSVRSFFRREVWHGLGALGSLRHDWRDKPFWATLVFGFGLMCAIAGVGLLLARGTSMLWVALVGAAIALGVVVLSTAYRAARRRPSLSDGVRLSVLFGVFYFGRLVALSRLALGWKNYRRTK